MIKCRDSNFFVTKFGASFSTNIKLILEKDVSMNILKDKIERMRDDFKLTSRELTYHLYYFDNDLILKIYIYHDIVEKINQIKTAIDDILNGSSYLLLYTQAEQNYYRFLCNLFMKEIKIIY